ncbi:hypothetical protein, partial [Mycolicibacterium agri]|uniref:hypothetical protein n=1 Tax=Mycolicibacterium agri TaxID=36811 RepID=UPI001A9C815C
RPTRPSAYFGTRADRDRPPDAAPTGRHGMGEPDVQQIKNPYRRGNTPIMKICKNGHALDAPESFLANGTCRECHRANLRAHNARRTTGFKLFKDVEMRSKKLMRKESEKLNA